MEVDVADGVLKSGDVPLLERMFESVYPDIINTIQPIEQITSHLRSPTSASTILQTKTPTILHNVQPSQPQAQQLLFFSTVRG
jgi:hypothetical protein